MRTYILLIVCTAMMVGCNKMKALMGKADDKENESELRIKMEAEGQKCLKASREALANKNFNEARNKVNLMRKKYELALNAREEGILLMDSICLKEAQHELQNIDSMISSGNAADQTKAKFDELCEKIKFYHRKLKYDKEHKQTR